MPLPMTRKSPRTSTVLSYQSLRSDARGVAPRLAIRDRPLQSSPIRIDVATRIAPRRPSGSATASAIGSPPLLDAHGVGARRFVVSSPVDLAAARRAHRSARSARVEPILHPRRRALQEPAVGLAHLRRADPRRRRSRQRHRRRRRRRHRRHRRLRRGHLPARHHARARADDAAGAGRQLDRRQGRRQPRARQEPDRRLPSAGASSSSIRCCCATLPRREFRSGLYEVVKYGDDRQPRRCSTGSPRDTKAIFARDPDGAGAGHRRVVPHQGRRRLEGRARERAAAHPQLRPHRRPRARGGHEVPALPPRRGDRLRHARRRRPRGRARRAGRARAPGAGRADRASSARCPPSPTCRSPRSWTRSGATRRWSTAGCTS